ncbi:helix-turn-helix domain-containing protein [Actinomycetospora endophytica]|uniref:Helix-turn-helix domain-containing protein n=1 Tax=Actinomycetospora endophytica TaxID=2291215 RepID=A0ABS8P709_9PSEU|nr:helix-turn-helix domain-containing protein [Actinomycetospora endophytica]MCD2193909.1 helix-turn-helix domain-containing protein [Actinomycetospora endophytica]
MATAGRFPPGRPAGPLRAAPSRTVPGSARPAEGRGPGGAGAEALRGLVVLHRRLSTLATAHDSGPAAVVALLAEELGAVAGVIGTGPEHAVLAACAPGVDEARAAAVLRAEVTGSRARRVLAAAERGGRALRVPGNGTWVRVVVPVVVGGDTAAFLIAEEDPAQRDRPAALEGDDVLLLAAEHAATIVGVLLGRERVLAAAAGHVRDDLLSGLLLGRARSAEEAAQWAEHVGFDAGVAHRVLVVVPRGEPTDPATAHPEPTDPEATTARPLLLAEVRDRLARLVPGVLALVRDSEVVALVPVAADPVAVGTAAARAFVRGLEPSAADAGRWPVTVALGREVDDVPGLPRSYDQARRTLDAARRLGWEGRLLRFDDLGVHRLLLQVPDPEDARAFAREVLGRLATDSSERTVELVRTLARYFREDGSPQRTAKVLSVHPNTVGYRLRRAEELSGLALDHYQDRLAAQVALEILGWME